MKKTWIIVGIVIFIILLLGGAWWYLLMNGRPEGFAIPNPFGGTDPGAFTPPPETPVEEFSTSTGALRKLSTNPVAGAIAITRDGKTYARFVERGTGHVYEADPENGTTVRLTNTTIPRVIEAVWSPQGSRAVLKAESADGEARVFVGTIERADNGEGTLVTDDLPATAKNIAFSPTGESVLYTVPSADGSTGYEHNLKTDTRTVRFTSPLQDIVAVWEPTVVVYTAPSADLPGYAYEGPAQKRIAGGIRGLTIFPMPTRHIISYMEGDSFVSRVDTPSGMSLGIPVFPEKCAADPGRTTVLWCAAPDTLAPGRYPDEWYEGSMSFEDSLWGLDLEAGSAMLRSTLREEASEIIDATGMSISDNGALLTFINKRNGSLWSYTLETVSPSVPENPDGDDDEPPSPEELP
ncbi:hypothetical protein HY416_02810 [Candidatus Kaiserbacteria bacterium]|nr:hypothetical protein [Candidatus Kaiserbacteria bacterium]